ncbi:transposase [Paenimyroides aestuarii]|uniref:Transposase n=1 Tax=Paenimyroides aestuarii TaxID=2968490 RepID=A0ABY5NPC4_9FLAO|nr:transposase [Paenimyroides aestuarii]UUV20366.1 transposase [Paenimyroides aestuarii]
MFPFKPIYFFTKRIRCLLNLEVCINTLSEPFPIMVHLAYETGCSGFSVASYFLNLGWLVLVVNPADVKKGDKERYQKTDVLDSKNLSNELKQGLLKGIYMPSEEQEQFTTLARKHRKCYCCKVGNLVTLHFFVQRGPPKVYLIENTLAPVN